MPLPDKSTRDPSFAPTAILLALGHDGASIKSLRDAVKDDTDDARVGTVLHKTLNAFDAARKKSDELTEQELRLVITHAAIAMLAIDKRRRMLKWAAVAGGAA